MLYTSNMTEKLATPAQMQTLDEATRTLVRDAPISPHLSGYRNEKNYAYCTNQPAGNNIEATLHMGEFIQEAEKTLWEVQIGVCTEKPKRLTHEISFSTMYSLLCVTDRQSGLRVSRRHWLYLNTMADEPTFYGELDPAKIDFTEAGRQEFYDAYHTGFASEKTRAYIGKLLEKEPVHAVTVAGYISQACGVNEQAETAAEQRKEPFIQHGIEEVSASFCEDFTKLLGGLSLVNQLGRASQ